MNKMKQWTSVLIVGALGVTAGCSGGDEPAGGGKNEAAGGTVKLEYFQMKKEVVETVNNMIKKFEEKNPGIHIEQNNVPNAQNVFNMRLSTQDTPPIFTHYTTSPLFIKAATDGFVADLTGDPLLKNVIPKFVEETKINGKNYLVPIAIGTWGVYYNLDVFNELKLEIPKTYAELIQTAEKIKSAGKLPFLFPDKNVGILGQEINYKLSLDVPDAETFIVDVMKGKKHIMDNPDMRKYAQKLLEMRKYGQKDSLGTDMDDAVREFALGKSAMYFQGIWSIQPMKKANPNIKFSMFPMPADKAEATKIGAFVDTAIGLPKDGKNAKEAKKFVDFLAAPDMVQYYVDETQYPSAVQGVKNNIAEIKDLNAMIEAGKTFPSISRLYPAGIGDDFSKATQGLFASGDIDAFLKKTDEVFFNKLNQ
ncbi:ABC transporter substrate-binding protein [Paenibacillus piri]|nr:extracellular solute-binding protein [Paenibacillus piri]